MTVTRTPLHTRNIELQGFLRSDGLWEVVGTLKDHKGYTFNLPDRGEVGLDQYLHHMTLTLTFDDQLNIVDVVAHMIDTPYQDCPGAEVRYQDLIGLQIKKGWIDDARQAIGRVTGCTHLTEMLPAMATAAIQTVRGYRLHNVPNYSSSGQERRQVADTCYGFRQGGRAQKRLWPDKTE